MKDNWIHLEMIFNKGEDVKKFKETWPHDIEINKWFIFWGWKYSKKNLSDAKDMKSKMKLHIPYLYDCRIVKRFKAKELKEDKKHDK